MQSDLIEQGDGNLVFPEGVMLERIAACVNFCREFPTEFLEENVLSLRFENSTEVYVHDPLTQKGDPDHGQESHGCQADAERQEEAQGR